MTDAALQRLIDKDAIRDCLMRYARGVDRHDAETLRSAYWPDAEDDHILYVGDVEGFIAFSFDFTQAMPTQHFLGQMLIEFESDRIALAETYHIASHDMATMTGRQTLVMKGRYLDRMEKRGAEWRIAHRTLTCDLFSVDPGTADWQAVFPDIRTRGTHIPNDPLYAILKARRNG